MTPRRIHGQDLTPRVFRRPSLRQLAVELHTARIAHDPPKVVLMTVNSTPGLVHYFHNVVRDRRDPNRKQNLEVDERRFYELVMQLRERHLAGVPEDLSFEQFRRVLERHAGSGINFNDFVRRQGWNLPK